MHILKKHLLLAILALATGCGTWVKTEYRAGTDFSALESYAWQAPEREKLEDPLLDSPLMDAKVRSAVESYLTAQGYTGTDRNSADFLVTYHAIRRIEDTPGNFQTGVGFYNYPYWHPFSSAIIVTENRDTYEAGVLVIDILDARTGELLWRGWRSKGLSESNFSAEGVQELVREILTEFPPGKETKRGISSATPVRNSI